MKGCILLHVGWNLQSLSDDIINNSKKTGICYPLEAFNGFDLGMWHDVQMSRGFDRG